MTGSDKKSRFGVQFKIVAFVALLSSAVFIAYMLASYRNALEGARSEGLRTADITAKEFEAGRQFYVSTIVKRSVDAGLQVSGAYRTADKTIPPHSEFIKEIAQSMSADTGLGVRLVSLTPINPANYPKDGFEKGALEGFYKGSGVKGFSFEEVEGKEVLRYMVPDVMTSQVCVDCHNKGQSIAFKLGDIAGALQITLPMDAEIKRARAQAERNIAYGSIAVASFIFLTFVFVRRTFAGPASATLHALRGLAQGDYSKVSGPHPSDEFGDIYESAGVVRDRLQGASGALEQAASIASDLQGSASTIERSFREEADERERCADELGAGLTEAREACVKTLASADSLVTIVEKGLAPAASKAGSVAEEITTATGALLEGMEGLLRIADNLSASMKDALSKSQDVFNKVAEASAEASHISASIKEATLASAGVLKDNSQCISYSEASKKGVEDIIRGMGGAEDDLRSISAFAKGFIERSSQIGKMLGLINEAAEEINLLALNSAIIAAQSGEHGRGFSVVASEIKDMAERMSVAAKDSGNMLGAMDEEARSSHDAALRLRAGLEGFSKTGYALLDDVKKTLEGLRHSHDASQEVARANSDQAKKATSVIEHMDAVEDNARTLIASIHQLKYVDVMAKDIERLSDIARRSASSSLLITEADKRLMTSVDDIGVASLALARLAREGLRDMAKAAACFESLRGAVALDKDSYAALAKMSARLEELNGAISSSASLVRPKA
jgi:methyl-accepting chemotaxis protein